MNEVRKLADEIARKKAQAKADEEARKRREHGAVAKQAVGEKKSLEKHIYGRAFLDRAAPRIKAAVVVFFLSAFAVTSFGALNRMRANWTKGFISAESVVLDPYAADRETRERLRNFESEIPEIVGRMDSSADGGLKSKIASPMNFEIVSVSRSKDETCAMVRFAGEKSEPVPAIFRWDINGKFLKVIY